MDNKPDNFKGYFYATTIGAIGGVIIVLIATRAIPKIISRMMSEMMRNMMT